MKKVLCALMAGGLVLTGCSSSGTKSKKDVKIGVIQYMQHDALDNAYKGFKDYLVKQGYSAKNITYKNASGDASNSETIADQLVNAQPDLIYAIATPCAQSVAKKTKDIPIRQAMDIYYKSKLSQQINDGSYGIENMDYRYLVQDLIENEPELFSTD